MVSSAAERRWATGGDADPGHRIAVNGTPQTPDVSDPTEPDPTGLTGEPVTADVPGAVLSINDLSKTFGGTRALAGVSFRVHPGEVHALVGENGSGKSTLIKTLSGFHTPDPGSAITVAGNPMPLPPSNAQLRHLGLQFVHQDLALAPNLTVAENLFVDELTTDPSWLVRNSVQHRRARDLLAPFGRALNPSIKVGALSPADQAHLAIVRAVSGIREHRRHAGSNPGVLVLDEVTAFLPSAGRAQLFDLIRDIVRQGDSVLFVSHYLDEVLEIASRVTVLRDGRLVSTVPAASLGADDLVQLILGRHLREVPARRASQSQTEHEDAVRVAHLSGSLVDDLAFSVRDGEVLGVTGLLGSGFEEVPALLFGAARATSGRMMVRGNEIDLTTLDPPAAVAQRIAFVPEDRQRAGGVGALLVEENITLQILRRYGGVGRLRRRRLTRDAAALLDEYDVRPRNPRARMSELSGGNQQKVILAKWLETHPQLLLLDEPTHGVDVGSREQILARIRAAAKGGMAVVCGSSDPEQLSELCDRVLILARGRVVAELSGADLSKDAIVEAGYRTVPESPAGSRPAGGSDIPGGRPPAPDAARQAGGRPQ